MDPARECAARLRALASDPRFIARVDDLNSIADELVDDDLDSWVGVDLVGAFPPDSTVELPARDVLQQILAALVGVFAFAPVGWTLVQPAQGFAGLS
jgi:hypothetical protein